RAHAGPIIYAMAGSGNGHLYGVDIGANTTTLIGTMPNGSGWSTVGETPDGTLFFMQRFLADIHIYSVAANNIHVSAGTVTNLMDRGTTTLGGNIDGLVNGPDGKLYISAYDNSDSASGPRNGLFRYDPTSGVTQYVGTFANNQGP